MASSSRESTIIIVIVDVIIIVDIVIPWKLTKQPARPGKTDQLTLKRLVSEYNSPSSFDDASDVQQRQAPFNHHVGDTHRRAAIDAESAVDQYNSAVTLGCV